MFYLTIVNKILCQSHSWLARHVHGNMTTQMPHHMKNVSPNGLQMFWFVSLHLSQQLWSC